MKVSSLTLSALARRLSHPGVVLPCGPVNVRVRSDFSGVAAGLSQMYADFALLPENTFVDFEVAVRAPSLLRARIRPQAGFFCDGRAPFRPVPVSQAFAMLEWGLNWVVSTHAHDHLILHAAVLARGERAVILAGDPGAGKSTLCAALMHDGWRLLSDELALVDLQTGRLRSLARPISLKNESIELIRHRVGDARISKVCKGTTKGDVAHVRPDTGSVRALDCGAQPAWLIFPRYVRGSALAVRPVDRARAMLKMVRHGFNYGLLGSDGFDALAALVERCDIWEAQYGALDDIVPRLRHICDQEQSAPSLSEAVS